MRLVQAWIHSVHRLGADATHLYTGKEPEQRLGFAYVATREALSMQPSFRNEKSRRDHMERARMRQNESGRAGPRQSASAQLSTPSRMSRRAS